MRLTIVLGLLLMATPSAGDPPNPLKTALSQSTRVPILKEDDKLTRLLKQSYNASHTEFRTKYHYWLQGLCTIDQALDALDRFQALRVEIEPGQDESQLLKQKILFVRQLQKQIELIDTPHSVATYRELARVTLAARLVSAELELERLKSKQSPKLVPTPLPK